MEKADADFNFRRHRNIYASCTICFLIINIRKFAKTLIEVIVLANTLLRGTIIYIAVIIAVRLMGKRQIGELQPSELVVTILLSEVAATSLEDDSTPLLRSLSLIFLLACLEVISSFICVKFPFFRKLVQGNSVLIINNGEIMQKELKKIRYSADDLTEALRLKDIFDIKSVDFAYVETNGSLSVKLKKNYSPPTKSDKFAEDGLLTCLVVSDGKIIDKEFNYCNMNKQKLKKILNSKGILLKDILFMTADKKGNYNIIKKKVD